MKKKETKFMVIILILFCFGQILWAICGDANSSGNISIVDALMVAQYVVGLNPQGLDMDDADVNGDGHLSIIDALQIAQYTVGILSHFSCAPTATNPPTVPPVVKIFPLGDSITDGFGVPGGYRIKLWSLIQNLGATIDFVGSLTNGPSELGDKDHEGHSGWRTDQIDSNINGWMDTYRPRIVLLHIGTNDMLYNASAAPNYLSSIIDKICAKLPSGGKLYVSSIIPLPFADSAVRTYNQQIPGIVQSKANEGKPVYFVEMYSALSTSDLDDNVHPNRTGYDKMADVWFDAIRDDLR
jgi:lysophospholipase L1-like esterase